jgi:hypothetical protein
VFGDFAAGDSDNSVAPAVPTEFPTTKYTESN